MTAYLGDPLCPQKRTLNPPKIFEAGRRKLGVSNCVLNVAVAQISLQRPCVVPLVGERVTAGVPEHVRVRFEAQFGLDPCPLHHAGKASGGEWRPSLRGKHERRLGLLLALKAAQRA